MKSVFLVGGCSGGNEVRSMEYEEEGIDALQS
jgi:hypothetical protein